MIIYKITNKLNKKSYIGQTTQNLSDRWKGHVKDSRRYDFALSRAIRKYGKTSFDLEILEIVSDLELVNEREIFWIDFYNSFTQGYNSTSGGGGGYVFTEEVKKKISESCSGRIHKDETKLLLSKTNMKELNPNFGKKWSIEKKVAQSERMKLFYNNKK